MTRISQSCPSRRTARTTGIVLVTGLVLSLTAPAVEAQVQWRNGVGAAPAQETRAGLAERLGVLAARPDRSRVVAHFHAPLTGGQKSALRRVGLDVLDYVGNNAYFATVRRGFDAGALSELGVLLSVEEINTAWKMHPDLYGGIVRGWTVVSGLGDFALGLTQETTREALAARGLDPVIAGTAMLHADASQAEAGQLVKRLGGEVLHDYKTVNGIDFHLPLSKIRELAGSDAVRYVEAIMPPLSTCNDDNRVRTETNTVHQPQYGLSGAGIDVLVYDGGTIQSHPGLTGRIMIGDSSGGSFHATHVGGTVGGTGAGETGNPHRGMAPAVARFLSYGVQGFGNDFFRNSPQMDTENDYLAAIGMGADIANNSVGNNIESNGYPCPFQGDYGTFSEMLDSLIRGERVGQNGVPFRTVWAAGNERQGSRCNVEGFGQFYSIAPPQAGKNQICVGAVNSNDDSVASFSSWGPTDDGRLKPDFCAPGCQSNGDGGVTSCAGSSGYSSLCGTSMASPTACGIAALFLEDWRRLNPEAPDPLNSTVKSIFMHTAVDLDDPGPDFKTGFGSIRAPRIIDLLRAGNYTESQVGQGESYTFVVVVAPTDTEFKATIVWDDYRGNAAVMTQLVNDLDLIVTDPSGTRHFPWTLNPQSPDTPAVRMAEDHRNNVEQVFVSDAMPGSWICEVRGTTVPQGPQRFSLVATPALLNCSDAGLAQLGETSYRCVSPSAAIRVLDCGLNVSNTEVDTVSVMVTSSSDPTGEVVTLTETSPASAEFVGTASLSMTSTPGAVRIDAGDTITLLYVDADNGQGGSNVMVTDTAVVVCTPPVAEAGTASVITGNNVSVQVSGTDDGEPGPALSFIVTQLPSHGRLRDGGTGAPIVSVPHALSGGGNTVIYRPLGAYIGGDSFQFVANDGGAPPGGGNSPPATVSVTVNPVAPTVQYEFLTNDQNPNWTSEGRWGFGQPAGLGSFDRDPTSGFTGANVLGYSIFGDYSNGMTPVRLTTGVLNLSDSTQTRLEFRRWLGIDASVNDHAAIQVSSDGTTWHDVWVHNGPVISETAWSLQVHDLSAWADHQASVRLRWVMGPTNDTVLYPGWNLDDIRVFGLRPTPSCPCDWNGSETINSQDFFDFLGDFFTDNADYNADGTTNSQDFFDFLSCFFVACP